MKTVLLIIATSLVLALIGLFAQVVLPLLLAVYALTMLLRKQVRIFVLMGIVIALELRAVCGLWPFEPFLVPLWVHEWMGVHVKWQILLFFGIIPATSAATVWMIEYIAYHVQKRYSKKTVPRFDHSIAVNFLLSPILAMIVMVYASLCGFFEL